MPRTALLTVAPPVEPMLAKLTDDLPRDGDFLFEPKWDGFRAIVFRGPAKDDVYIQSRDLRPLDRYFPELHEIFLEQLPSGAVVDGEIVMPTPHGLDFTGLQMRLHPAASRVAKPATAAYQPGKRAMFKIKHARTADCVVAGFRWHKSGKHAVGSLLLGLYDDEGTLQHVGVTSSFTMAMRKQLVKELAPLRKNALQAHPWREWAGVEAESSRMPGSQSRWSAGKDMSWEPLRIERVAEVKYDHLQGDRFRHATVFQRWRPDKKPSDCRYDQLEVTPAYELEKVFGA